MRIIRSGLDRGLNFMDNSWDYQDGRSEERVGKALRDGYRGKAFVMTKLDGRTKASAAKQLMNPRNVCRWIISTCFSITRSSASTIRTRSSLRAAQWRRFSRPARGGKIRFIGFTGHKDPHVHLYMLAKAAEHGFHFDTVQMLLNLMDPHFRSFEKAVLPVLVSEGIGVLGMKSMGSGVLLKSKTVAPIDCLHYAMSLPTSVVITGIDSMAILDQAFDAARDISPLAPQQVSSLLGKTAPRGGGWPLANYSRPARILTRLHNIPNGWAVIWKQ